MEIRKILWPTDLSHSSAAALPYVKSLARKYGAEIILVFVADDMSEHEPWYGEFETKHLKAFHDWIVKQAEERMEKLCKEDLEGCPYFRRRILSGDPAKQILRAIEEESPDIVVMANHGMGGHFPFGSVTEKVVKHSPKPVMTVRPEN